MRKMDSRRWTRQLLQLFFFLFYPSLYTAAFSGLKYIVGQVQKGEPITANAFLYTLLALCGFTIVFGRFFCGFVCAFGTLGDAFYSIAQSVRGKLGKKQKWFSLTVGVKLQKIKYLLLLGIVLLYAVGRESLISGMSPWEVFSMLYAGKIQGSEYLVGWILLGVIIVGMCCKERFFCQYLCPMGAVFAWLPVLPVFALHRDSKECLPKCRACQMRCPVDLKLEENNAQNGECIQCLECMQTCKKGNISIGSSELKGNEILLTLLKVVLLFVICILLEQLTGA